MLPEDDIRTLFPGFENELIVELAETSQLKTFKHGDVLMKTGQYIRSTMILVSGLIKVYREDEEGNEFFMYYIEPGQACALSMVCTIKQNISELTAKAVGDIEVLTVLKSNTIPYTHAEIANELNSSREVISRLMKKLSDKGCVKLNRNSIEIISLDKFDL